MKEIAEIRRENLFKLSKTFGSQRAFADKLEMSPGYINQLLNGHRNIGEKVARKIEVLCGIQDTWLDTWKGNKTRVFQAVVAPFEIETNAHETRKLGVFKRVPVVGHAQLGDNGHWSEFEYPVGHGEGYINFPTSDSSAYALRCVGDSMRPRIKPGEFAIIEPNTSYESGDEVLVKAMDGRVMIKTYLYKRDGMIHLISVNESHPPQTIPADQIDKIHYVSAIAKKALWTSDE